MPLSILKVNQISFYVLFINIGYAITSSIGPTRLMDMEGIALDSRIYASVTLKEADSDCL